MEGWVDLGGWLHPEMVYLPKAVTHRSINRARRTVTSLIGSDALPLHHAYRHQITVHMHVMKKKKLNQNQNQKSRTGQQTKLMTNVYSTYLNKLLEHSRLNHATFIQASCHLVKINYRPTHYRVSHMQTFTPPIHWIFTCSFSTNKSQNHLVLSDRT